MECSAGNLSIILKIGVREISIEQTKNSNCMHIRAQLRPRVNFFAYQSVAMHISIRPDLELILFVGSFKKESISREKKHVWIGMRCWL